MATSASFFMEGIMSPSVECVTAIQGWEGLRLQVYNDLNGYPTIGYGHKLQAGEAYPNGITQEQADALFTQDCVPFEKQIDSLELTLTQGQYDALFSFLYNLGISALKTMLGHGLDQVPQQLPRWVNAGGKQQPGLVARRNQEVVWWNS